MFIIPIGTKSSLALKPKVTIGLIVVNIVIALITLPLGLQTVKGLFKAQRDRYAAEVRLYLNEHADNEDGGYRFDADSMNEHRWTPERMGDHFQNWILKTRGIFREKLQEIMKRKREELGK